MQGTANGPRIISDPRSLSGYPLAAILGILILFGLMTGPSMPMTENSCDTVTTVEDPVNLQGTKIMGDVLAAGTLDWDAPLNRTTGDYPTSVFVGDANNDGQNDIITADLYSNQVSVWLWNTTNVTWNDAAINRTTGNYPTSVFVGDANNDGQNDIITSDALSDQVSVWLWNTTNATWNDAAVNRTCGAGPSSVFVGDANNDGQNDIITTDQLSDQVSVWLWNTTNATWNDAVVSRTTGTKPTSVFVGDANNDGQNDIITTDRDSNQVSVWLWNTTNATWNDAVVNITTGNNPVTVFVGDANNDGQNDIVTSDSTSNQTSIILWYTTNATWNDQTTKMTTGSSPLAVYVGDANNDGYNDIVATETSNQVLIYLWNPVAGTWDLPINKTTVDGPASVFVGDANSDGLNDIVTAEAYSDQVLIFLFALPSAPQDLQITPGNQNITLTWNPPAGSRPVTNYTVYRGTSSGSEAFLVTLGNETSYMDTDVTNTITYYYRVSANNSAGEGLLSSEVNATPTSPPSTDTSPDAVLQSGSEQVVPGYEIPILVGLVSLSAFHLRRRVKR